VNRALAFIAVAGLAASSLRSHAQDLPEELREEALVVKVHASVTAPGGAAGTAAAWQEENVKYTVSGVPVVVRLQGTNILVMTQVTPFVRGDSKLNLVAQGQVWVRSPAGLSYRTTLDSVSVEYGESVFFYPLGVDAAGRAPLRIDISVSRRTADSPEQTPPGPEPKSASPSPDPAAPVDVARTKR